MADRGRLLVDLHNHTSHSYDAQNRLADYERAHAQGRIDVVAITDHNTIAGALELRAAGDASRSSSARRSTPPTAS